jgi:hypothetical protein
MSDFYKYKKDFVEEVKLPIDENEQLYAMYAIFRILEDVERNTGYADTGTVESSLESVNKKLDKVIEVLNTNNSNLSNLLDRTS